MASPNATHVHDPLYDPVHLSYAWGLWLGTTLLLGDRVGLLVLVVATTALLAWAIATDVPVAARPFVVDLGVILLCCAAAIAAGVLGIDAATAALG